MKISRKEKFATGFNVIVNKTEHPEMMGLDFGVLAGNAGNEYSFTFTGESVFVLLKGKVKLSWCQQSAVVAREDSFHDDPIVLHVPRNTPVKVEIQADETEVAVANTANEKDFAPLLFSRGDLLCPNEERGEGTLNECSTRLVRTFFDRSTRPETNFFLGEVVSYPGKWSSFPPHTHVEPEIYFYKFLPENGYGFAEIGDEVFKVKHNELTGMPAHLQHSQATAPGYAEYYLWIIRLRDDEAMVTTVVPEHEWTVAPDAKYFPEI